MLFFECSGIKQGDVMMNEAFIKAMEDKKLTGYALSHESGVPYTTINRLTRGILDINRCESEAVSRLSLVLGKKMEELLNPYAVMNKVEGKYKKIHYTWEAGEDGRMMLKFLYKKNEVKIVTENEFKIPGRKNTYKYAAGAYIDKYIKGQNI